MSWNMLFQLCGPKLMLISRHYLTASEASRNIKTQPFLGSVPKRVNQKDLNNVP